MIQFSAITLTPVAIEVYAALVKREGVTGPDQANRAVAGAIDLMNAVYRQVYPINKPVPKMEQRR